MTYRVPRVLICRFSPSALMLQGFGTAITIVCPAFVQPNVKYRKPKGNSHLQVAYKNPTFPDTHLTQGRHRQGLRRRSHISSGLLPMEFS